MQCVKYCTHAVEYNIMWVVNNIILVLMDTKCILHAFVCPFVQLYWLVHTLRESRLIMSAPVYNIINNNSAMLSIFGRAGVTPLAVVDVWYALYT